MANDCGDVSKVYNTIPPKPTYRIVQVGEFETRTEQVEVKADDIPFDYRDFSLNSIIASGNTQLLNPTGVIPDSHLSAHDNVNAASDAIDNFAERNFIDTTNVEPTNAE